jgi:hypothetical protein
VNDTALALEDTVATTATGDIWPFRGRSTADLTIHALTNSRSTTSAWPSRSTSCSRYSGTPSSTVRSPDVWTGERHRGV